MGFSGKRKTSYTAFLAVMFAAAAVFLIWRAPYGYSFDDESFIVSLALRLTKGDMLLTGEWHGTRNVTVLHAKIVIMSCKMAEFDILL